MSRPFSARSCGPLALLALTVGVLPAARLAAQPTMIDLQVVAPSVFLDGCPPPSPCDCLVLHVGSLTGTFRMALLPPPLLPILDYSVQDIAWDVTSTSGVPTVPAVITGVGAYHEDIAADLHSMDLDLVLDGVPRTFTSGGYVPANGGLASGSLSIYLYASIDGCLYQGIELHAVVTDVPPSFRRADCNGDGSHDISDAIEMLQRLFSAVTVVPPCRDACDANDDGGFDIADPVYTLNYLFAGGAEPPTPFAACGEDPTPDGLECLSYPPCVVP